MTHSYPVQLFQQKCQYLDSTQLFRPDIQLRCDQLYLIRNKTSDLNKLNIIIKSDEFYKFISSIARMAIMLQYVEENHAIIVDENKIMDEVMIPLHDKLNSTSTYLIVNVYLYHIFFDLLMQKYPHMMNSV